MKLYDTVRLRRDIPEEGLRTGDLGAIVAILHEPYEAFEVEFVDTNGRTVAEVALRGDDLELVR